LGRPGELLEVEGIASALAEQARLSRAVEIAGQQRLAFIRRER
jgi:hypothetical protein